MIYREITAKIQHWLGQEKIIIIKGSRQVGKTTLLKYLESELRKQGKQTYFSSIDQEIGNPIFENSKNFSRFLRDQFPNASKDDKLYLFLDEFQFLKDAGIFLKTLFDESREYLQPIVSGSSSLEIAKSSEFLTGRGIEFFLYPLSYKEFLSYKTKLNLPKKPLANFREIEEFYDVYKNEINAYTAEYRTFGGYPEVVTTVLRDDKQTILKALVRTYIEKDIIAFFRLENVGGFQNLLKILASQIGNMVNKSELANTTNMSIDTVNKYLEILEGTYVFEFVKPYFTNVRKEVSKMPKVFINDFGLRNIVLNSFPGETPLSGGERENFVYNILKSSYGRENIFYYRTLSKTEIDFIVSLENKLVPLEVKSGVTRPPAILASFKTRNANTAPYAILANTEKLAKEGTTYFFPTTILPFVEMGKLE
jgi:predicted AAA+ superfamily ATPase